jgi:hypothetical protein
LITASCLACSCRTALLISASRRLYLSNADSATSRSFALITSCLFGGCGNNAPCGRKFHGAIPGAIHGAWSRGTRWPSVLDPARCRLIAKTTIRDLEKKTAEFSGGCPSGGRAGPKRLSKRGRRGAASHFQRARLWPRATANRRGPPTAAAPSEPNHNLLGFRKGGWAHLSSMAGF